MLPHQNAVILHLWTWLHNVQGNGKLDPHSLKQSSPERRLLLECAFYQHAQGDSNSVMNQSQESLFLFPTGNAENVLCSY